MIQGLRKEITEIPAFGHDITEVRAMGQLVWQKSIPDYLCFTALESGTFTLTIGSNVTSSYLSYIEWSKDGRNWNRTDVTSSEQTIEVSVVQDDKVYWRGRGNAMSRSYAAANSSRFSSDCQFNASGNLMSLLTENFETVTSWRYTAAFSSIFNGCTTLISAKDMTIPLATLGASTFQYTFAGATAMTSALTMNVSDIGADCFNSAFQGCSALTDISGLKMTLGTLPNKAFYCAFLACSSLVLPPPITFTSLDTTKEQHCYRMFGSCTSLTSSFPLMPATLASNCYQRMYYGCSSLNYVKCLATDISATNCLQNWLYGVSSTGTFIQAEGVTWPRGASGIPNGWIINPDYLCFTALDDNTQFTFTKYINLPNTTIPSISYSLDNGSTWTDVQMSGQGNEDIVTTPAVNAGGKVLWKAEAGRFALAPDKYSTFTANGRFNVSGNIMSLLYGDNHYDKTDTRAYTYTLGSLFRDSTNLIDASQLKLPTGHMNAADLLGLFRGCTNLVHGAPLYAPNIPDSCCYWMYYGCTSMTEMPTIAATSMIKDNGDPCNYGLYYTFYNCSNMEGEVKLNIVGDVGQQVLDACFSYCSKITSADLAFNGALGKMALRGAFVGCTSLSHVKCLATSFYDDGTAANGSLYNWMNNVSSTGVFVQAEGVQWPQGKSGIPTGWVDVEKRTMPSGYKQVEYVANPNKPSAAPAPIIETGIVLDPSQDTIEIAVFPTLDEDGYIAHYKYGGMPLSNNSSPGQKGSKVGRFYFMFRKLSTDDVIQFTYNRETSASVSLGVSNKITQIAGTPQVAKIELSSGNNKMYLNGTQVANNSYTCDVSDMGAETAKLFGHSVYYNWIDPIYYMKWWRNGVLIADYVACVRESDNEPSFYDFVSNTFKVPTRTRFFTAGEEI